MPIWTGPRDVVEELASVYRGVVPPDVGTSSSTQDEIYAAAEMMAIAENVQANWIRQGLVSTAEGDYLVVKAREVALFPQGAESDASLRERIRTPPATISPDLILEALQQIVDANGGGTVYLQELPRDSLFLSRHRCLSRGWRIGGAGHAHMVIALIPASAHCLAACTDALRAKRAAGKNYLVQEYT